MTPLHATLPVRLLCVVYEMFVVAGILMAASLPFVMLTRYSAHPELRPAYQLYLLLVMGYYFCYFWTRAGQTVAMRPWRVQLVNAEGVPPDWRRAVLRYLLAWPSWLTGIGVLWMLWDEDGQFLHDRILGLRLIRRLAL